MSPSPLARSGARAYALLRLCFISARAAPHGVTVAGSLHVKGAAVRLRQVLCFMHTVAGSARVRRRHSPIIYNSPSYGVPYLKILDDGCGRAECLYERAGPRVHVTRFIVARRVGDYRWERHGDEQGVDVRRRVRGGAGGRLHVRETKGGQR